eukprot:3203511-Ditylum_brightwellii.AAC.1
MVQLTLCHGVCKESCFAMASFSFFLCQLDGQFDDFKASDHIGHLSVVLLERCKAEEYRGYVHALYYGATK